MDRAAQPTGTPTPTSTPTATTDASGAGIGDRAGTTVSGIVDLLLPGVVPELERLVLALVVLAAGVYLSKFVVRLLGRPVARRFDRQSVAQTVLRLVRLGVILGTSLVSLTVLQVPLGNLVLSAAVFSAVLGIVLAPIVGSTINGLFVLADQPYEIGDMVELEDGTRGFIDEMTIRFTKVLTMDNTFLVVPNSVIREQRVTNFSAEDERTRLRFSLLVTYESDVGKARRLMERAASRVDIVIEGGPAIRVGSSRYSAAPVTYIDQFADNGVLLTTRYWTTKPYALLKLRSMIQTELWDLLGDADDVEVAYPHQHLMFDDTSGTARIELGGAATNGRSEVSPNGGDPGGDKSTAATAGGRVRPDPREATSRQDDSPVDAGHHERPMGPRERGGDEAGSNQDDTADSELSGGVEGHESVPSDAGPSRGDPGVPDGTERVSDPDSDPNSRSESGPDTPSGADRGEDVDPDPDTEEETDGRDTTGS
jgi:small-conductance mechanosensitive channel